MNSTHLSENEYAPFYAGYIKSLGTTDLLPALENSYDELFNLVKDLNEEQLNYRYEPGKWTIKEILQHIMDAERVLSYRALRFSRNDTTEIPGFDEDWYVDNSNGNDRKFQIMLNEFGHIRQSTFTLFTSFTDEMLRMTGSANKSLMSVRALGFVIAGHQLHHTRIIAERYL